MTDSPHRKAFVSLGLFIIDSFEFLDEEGKPTGVTREPQIGGGGIYAAVGARIWLSPRNIGNIVDRGHDFPAYVQTELDELGGDDMFYFRDDATRKTTTAVNRYRGDFRMFEYTTPRVQITPKDTLGTPLEHAKMLHFICSPQRAAVILGEVAQIEGWSPQTIYEPIPDRCVPAELPALEAILPQISILSPNAEEALTLLSLPSQPTKELVEQAGSILLAKGTRDAVIIRSGAMGAYVLTRDRSLWVPAFWMPQDAERVVDVTGAGNAFLGGLAAGLHLTDGDVFEAALYGSVSAAFTIEQGGLPRLSGLQYRTGHGEMWNDDMPHRRHQEKRPALWNAMGPS
ncbi:Ribokinase-like protein [Exidia glandulosa HHB12029]|uniref:Ribokinase-like protein n=1 Tax=Exidia glandulosa HHB12029 TaxID=1314781 RepID=A0A165R0S5_EXIGL|nr:Ribokinase-like protein [Exidia glandulosa HHB12029]